MKRGLKDDGNYGLGFAVTLCALLFALTFRALIPTGYMLKGDHGEIELVLCASGGLRTVIVDAGGRPADDQHAPDDHKAPPACAFAGVSAIAPDEAPKPERLLRRWVFEPLPLPPVVVRDSRNPRGPPPPLRGPPVLMV